MEVVPQVLDTLVGEVPAEQCSKSVLTKIEQNKLNKSSVDVIESRMICLDKRCQV